jgi:hypothetical protein
VSVARTLVTEAEFLSLPESMQRMELTRRYIYAEAGVRELWTVEPAGFVER